MSSVVFIIRLSNLKFFFFLELVKEKSDTTFLSFFCYIIFIDCHSWKTDDICEVVYQPMTPKLVETRPCRGQGGHRLFTAEGQIHA